MPRGNEALNAIRGRTHQGANRRGNEHMRDEHGKISQAFLLGLPCSHGIRRSRGLESDSEKHDAALRMRSCDLQRLQRSVRNPHIAAFGLGLEQVRARARNPQHVAVGNQRDIGKRCEFDGLVDRLQGGDADGTTRAVHQFDVVAEQLVETVAHDGVRLPAADLHQHPLAAGAAGDFSGQRVGDAMISILVDILHEVSEGGLFQVEIRVAPLTQGDSEHVFGVGKMHRSCSSVLRCIRPFKTSTC